MSTSKPLKDARKEVIVAVGDGRGVTVMDAANGRSISKKKTQDALSKMKKA